MSDIFLHGPAGSGKTVLALEVAQTLQDQSAADSLFWYDFEPEEHRTVAHLIRRLAIHFVEHQGEFEPLEACLSDEFGQDTSTAVAALVAAVRNGRHALVFDNVHFAQGRGQTEILTVLDGIVQAVREGRSYVLFTSWFPPPSPLNTVIREVDGLTESEVASFLDLYDVQVSERGLQWISALAHDITCVEEFTRSAEWRAEVEAGKPAPTEPDALRGYWLSRFLAPVQESGRRLLLALAVLGEPSERDVLERVAAVRGFASVVETLRRSPPLVRVSQGRYYLHSNVARAVLAISDRSEIQEVHRLAADHLRSKRRYTAAARHLLAAEQLESAADVLYQWREDAITSGQLDDLQGLVQQLQGLRATSEPYKLHAILASCAQIRGQFRRAEQHWNFALRGSPSALETAVFHNRRGDTYRLASNYEMAAVEYELAVQQTHSHSEPHVAREFGRASLGLAKLNRLRANYPEALERYTEAHEAFEVLFDQVGLMETEFGVGEVRRLLGAWTQAHDAYEVSLGRAREGGNVERQAYAQWGIGEVARLTGRFDSAIDTHLKGLDLCVKVGDARSEGWALLGLAETKRAIGNLEESRSLYEEALARFRLTQSDTEIAHCSLGLAEQGRAEDNITLDLYDEATEVYERKGLRHCIVLCSISKAAALRVAGQAGAQVDQLLTKARRLASECGLAHELGLVDELESTLASIPTFQLNLP